MYNPHHVANKNMLSIKNKKSSYYLKRHNHYIIKETIDILLSCKIYKIKKYIHKNIDIRHAKHFNIILYFTMIISSN